MVVQKMRWVWKARGPRNGDGYLEEDDWIGLSGYPVPSWILIFGSIFDRLLIDFWSILGRFWDDFGSILGSMLVDFCLVADG